MNLMTQRWRQPMAILAITTITASTAVPLAWAASEKSAPASTAPTETLEQQVFKPNPAADKALSQHFESFVSALASSTSAPPDPKAFTDEFHQQASPEKIKEVLDHIHQAVGTCRIAAKAMSPISYAGSYLLQCEKAFVPMEITIEGKAPYRINSLEIHPGFWK